MTQRLPETEGEPHADPDDGRATSAVITPKGVTALKATAPLYLAKIEEHFTRHLTNAEQRAIAIGLAKVIAAHDKPLSPEV